MGPVICLSKKFLGDAAAAAALGTAYENHWPRVCRIINPRIKFLSWIAVEISRIIFEFIVYFYLC